MALAAALALALPATAAADEPAPGPLPSAPTPAAEEAPPPNYVGLFVGTSLGYRPPGGPFDVAPGDLTIQVGYGRAITPALSLELDVGPTFIDGEYVSLSLVPSAIYLLSPSAYAAARVIVPVDPELNVGLAPGLGLARAFGANLAILELGVVSFVGKGDPISRCRSPAACSASSDPEPTVQAALIAVRGRGGSPPGDRCRRRRRSRSGSRASGAGSSSTARGSRRRRASAARRRPRGTAR